MVSAFLLPARGSHIAAEGENYRTGMETIEKIEKLKREAEEQRDIIGSEREKIEKVKNRCGIIAAILCTGSMELVEVITGQALEQINLQKKKISEVERKKLDAAVRKFLEVQAKQFKSMEADEKLWPHVSCISQVRLDEKLQKAQFELKGIENKMLDGTRAQLRKRTLQMEEMKKLCSRMEQALVSIEAWEKLFLMFLDDMEIRRRSGMDETFYQMEREDIYRKLCTCFEFSEVIGRELDEKLCLAVRNTLNQLGYLLAEYEFHLPKSIWSRGRSKISYTGTIGLTDELHTELTRYSAGILFIEKHLYNIELAQERLQKVQKELECLTDESGGADRLVV